MGDKSLLFSANDDAFLMYRKRGRSWVALFGPIGNPAAHSELVWRFVELARRHGGRAVFYEVPGESLSIYADAGLSAFKLGEEARVRLDAFDLKGSRRASIRTALNKTERDGIVFELLPVERVGDVMDELERVSAAWLAEHAVREKAFSLGAFERGYIAAQPVAVLKRQGRILAFANVMTTGKKEEATVDLMRFDPEAPNGSMEVLFARLLVHFKQEGYTWFSLGMAPLAGLSENPAAPIWHRVGRAAYDHGEAFYNFRGLRAFKNKFDPIWAARYMAVAGGLSPLLAIADVTVLIGGGIRGVISKVKHLWFRLGLAAVIAATAFAVYWMRPEPLPDTETWRSPTSRGRSSLPKASCSCSPAWMGTRRTMRRPRGSSPHAGALVVGIDLRKTFAKAKSADRLRLFRHRHRGAEPADPALRRRRDLSQSDHRGSG